MTGIETSAQPAFREAQAEDAELLLELMREFTATQTYLFKEIAARHSLHELLASPTLGRVWVIESRGSAVGYIVLTFGFSLEYGGRDAFVDEFFVRSLHRGGGLGRAALSFVLGQAACLGVRAVHLEVDRVNLAAHQLYQSLGFEGNDRHLLTKRLHAG